MSQRWRLEGAGSVIRTPSVAAVHESGHAVASVDFGIPFRGVRVHRRRVGSGITYGTGRVIHLLQVSDAELWGRVISLLTGGFAEARYRRCNAAVVFLSTASGDWKQFEQHGTALSMRVMSAVCRAGAKLGESEVHEEIADLAVSMAETFAHEFVRNRWPIILTLAASLDARGFLTAPEVREIVGECEP